MQRGWLLGVGAEPDFGELRALAADAGVSVIGETWQRGNPHPNTYLGSGRLASAVEEARSADLVLTVDPLTPRQERLLEQEFDKPVLDWTGIVLDLFARRATTAEGKLQTELAQCQYLFGRARGLWTHLERLGGGIGTRGPGETQLESDRRMLRERMTRLERRVNDIGVHRSRLERAGGPTIAIAGYTNAGKTTLLGTLADPSVHGADRLFATLDPQRRAWRCGGMDCSLTDTVGLISKLPTELVRAFDATLSVAAEADLVIHAVDVASPRPLEQYETVRRTLERIGAVAPQIPILTKVDQVESIPAEFDGILVVDPRTGAGTSALALAIVDRLCAPEETLTVLTSNLDRMRSWGSLEEIDRRGETSEVVYRPLRSSTFRWGVESATNPS